MLNSKEYYYVKPVAADVGKTMFVIIHQFADGREFELPTTYWDKNEAQDLVEDLNRDLSGEDN